MVWVFDHLRFNRASGFLKRHTGSLITEGFSAESMKNGPSSVMCMNSCRSALAFVPVGVDLFFSFSFFFCRSWFGEVLPAGVSLAVEVLPVGVGLWQFCLLELICGSFACGSWSVEILPVGVALWKFCLQELVCGSFACGSWSLEVLSVGVGLAEEVLPVGVCRGYASGGFACRSWKWADCGSTWQQLPAGRHVCSLARSCASLVLGNPRTLSSLG